MQIKNSHTPIKAQSPTQPERNWLSRYLWWDIYIGLIKLNKALIIFPLKTTTYFSIEWSGGLELKRRLLNKFTTEFGSYKPS